MASQFILTQGMSWHGRGPSGRSYSFQKDQVTMVSDEQDENYFRNDPRFSTVSGTGEISHPDTARPITFTQVQAGEVEAHTPAPPPALLPGEQLPPAGIPPRFQPVIHDAAKEVTAPAVESASNDLACPKCGKVCKNKFGLNSHMKTHIEEEPLEV